MERGLLFASRLQRTNGIEIKCRTLANPRQYAYQGVGGSSSSWRIGSWGLCIKFLFLIVLGFVLVAELFPSKVIHIGGDEMAARGVNAAPIKCVASKSKRTF